MCTMCVFESIWMKILWVLLTAAYLYYNSIVIANSTSKSGNYAATKGTTVRMNCLPPDAKVDKSNVKGAKSFVWTDEDGKEIVNPRMDKLPTGQLKIVRVRESDSGVYHCKFRPPAALVHDGAVSKIFVHKLIVYELSGHKFETLVSFDVTQHGTEVTITLLRDMLKKKICVSQLCSPGAVTSKKCEVTEAERQMCEISMIYEAVEPAETAKCGEKCVRNTMIDKLKKAQRVLETALLAQSENSLLRLKPDMQTFDTKHVIICKEGYHLVESNYEHCFPCLPGTYSEPESLKCEMCPIGFYQEKYGRQICDQCLDDKTTEMVGSKSRDECRAISDTGILKDIKEGIASIFKG